MDWLRAVDPVWVASPPTGFTPAVCWIRYLPRNTGAAARGLGTHRMAVRDEARARSPHGARESKLRPMRRTPVFGDPKTDFVFQRVFGSEDHKTALLGFLNDILQLDEAHRITSVVLLPPEQRPKVSELKNSIVDVKCVDAAGTTYVVEMQVFNVEEFEKRVVYNVAKAYTNQLGVGFAYPELDDVIGITICNFELWPRKQAPHVPMLSRWRMQEQESGVKGLPHLQFVFLELPKYAAGHDPRDPCGQVGVLLPGGREPDGHPRGSPGAADPGRARGGADGALQPGGVGRVHRGEHGDPERAGGAVARAQGGRRWRRGSGRRVDRAPGSRRRGAGRRARPHPGREGFGPTGAVAEKGRHRLVDRRSSRRAELRTACRGPAAQPGLADRRVGALRAPTRGRSPRR